MAVVAALLVALGAFGLGSPAQDASADVTKLRIVSEHGIDPAPGTTTSRVDCDAATGARAPGTTGALPAGTEVVGTSATVQGSILICVNITNAAGTNCFTPLTFACTGALTFDSNDYGSFDRAACGPLGIPGPDGDVRTAEWPDDECTGVIGNGTDILVVEWIGQSTSVNDMSVVIVRYTCQATAGNTTISATQVDNTGKVTSLSFAISCRGQAGGLTITAAPTTVEIIPAPSNTAHSLIQVTATDSAGTAILIAPGTEVDFITDRCAVEESGVDSATETAPTTSLTTARAVTAALTTALPSTFLAQTAEANANPPDTTSPQTDQSGFFDFDLLGLGGVFGGHRSMAAAWLHCDPHSGLTVATPGVATVQACVDVVGGADICRTVTVTVIGPPASITVAASPTALRCGEKSTITVTVKDAIGQNVSDHTPVELVTNLGGTIGGTGGVAAGFGLVSPISSNGASTFGGVATAFLLTSESHSGPYEVVATTGGTAPLHDFLEPGLLLGVFSTPPISAQVTVTCTIPAPVAPTAAAITAPRTGTGIVPPNTGDAGLLGSSSSSWTLFAIGGMAAFALAGLATLKFARR